MFFIDFKENTSYAFHAIVLNYFVDEVLKKYKDKKSSQLYFRLFRTGIIGDILYKEGRKHIKSEEHTAEMELLTAFFESYMFMVRSVYDYLLHFLKEKYGVQDTSFASFLKRLEKGGYPTIKGNFRDHLLKRKTFDEIRALRDSIKRQTPLVSMYVKENKYWVDGTIYKRDGTKEEFENPLWVKIFSYTTALLLLMAYIAEAATGTSLEEQLKYQQDQNKAAQ